MFEEGAQLKEKFGADNVFDFSLGNPDLDPPAEFFDQLKNLSAGSVKGIHGYMANAGFPEVRKALAEKVSAVHGVNCGMNHIILTCGAAGGLNDVFKTILNPGEEVVVPKPFFPEYRFYVDNHGGEIILVDSNDDFSLNLDAIRQAISDKTKVVLINSPNNPTGRVYPEKDLKTLVGILDSKNTAERTIYLVSDEPYRELVYDNITVPSILALYKHSIVVSSFSKNLSLPGERIGYIAVQPECRDVDIMLDGLILSNRILGFVNAPAFMQRIIAGLLDVTVNVEVYKKRRDILAGGLRDAGYEFALPEGAFYIFCKSPVKDDVDFVNHLKKYNILAVPGIGFGGEGYFRISYCVSEDVIARSIPGFKKAIDDL